MVNPRDLRFVAAVFAAVALGWCAGFLMRENPNSRGANHKEARDITRRTQGDILSSQAEGSSTIHADDAPGTTQIEGQSGGDFDRAVRGAMSLSDDTDRVVRLRDIARSIDLADLPAAVERARRLSQQERWQVLAALGARWAEEDPAAAAAYALKNAATRWGYNPLLNAVLDKWASIDLSAASNWLSALSAIQRSSHTQALVGSLIRRDPQAALQLLEKQPGASQQEYLYQQIFDQWAQRDPSGASTAAQNLPAGNVRERALRAVAGSWASENPAAALEWAGTFQDTAVRTRLMSSIGEAWADADSKAALAWARTIDDPALRQQLFSSTLARIAQADPAEAMSVLRTLPPGQVRDNTVSQVLTSVVRQDVKGALEFLELLPEGQIRDSSKANLINQLVRVDSKAATELLMTLPPQMITDRVAQVANTMANENLDAALEWSRSLPEGQMRKNAMNGICAVWAGYDPRAAAEWMLKEQPGADVSSVLAQWASSAPRDVLTWARSVTNEDTRRGALTFVVQTLSRTDTAEARNVFMHDLTPEAQAASAPGLAQSLARRDLAGTRAWAESLPPGPARDGALSGVIREWASQDAAGAARWIEQMPPGESRDTVVTQFAGNVMRREPESAIAWAASISEPQLRSTQLEQLATRWMQTDAGAARQWLAATDTLGESAKRRILNQRPVQPNYYGGNYYYGP